MKIETGDNLTICTTDKLRYLTPYALLVQDWTGSKNCCLCSGRIEVFCPRQINAFVSPGRQTRKAKERRRVYLPQTRKA
ncbi:MAG: hypothetical protein ABR533_02170, partial [Desulfonatronovibrio sp.]